MTALEDPPVELSDVQMEIQLLLKLCAAAEAIDLIDKDKRNNFHSYDYASAESYLMTCRRELLSRKILVLAGATDPADRARQTSQGESAVTTVTMHFRVIDCETAFALEIPWIGRGEDPMDKGVSKALTNSIKTFLRQQLLLPTGDDPEADSSTDERAGQRPNASSGDGQNLINEARGLSNEQLNGVLVGAGLPAANAPFGAFARIPGPSFEAVRAELRRLKGE